MTVELHRGNHRFVTRGTGRQAWHAFSFGEHHDPERLGFGPLVAHNEELLGPGLGYDVHAHSDLEIVTWVLSGELVHDGSERLPAGTVAVQSAGDGIRHSERAGDAATRFVQMWLRPDEPGGQPRRASARPTLTPGEPTVLVGEGGLPIGIRGAALVGVRLEAGTSCTLPAAPLVHAWVATGALGRSSLAEPLSAGDAMLATDHPALTVTATVPTLLLVWTFDR